MSFDVRPTAVVLYAANGSPIKVIGEKRIKLDLGLRCNFHWSLIIADVTSPIIGSDFIKQYYLLLDLRRNRLIDNVTGLVARLSPSSRFEAVVIKTYDSSNCIANILEQFADITELSLYGSATKSTIIHRIETTRQPVFAARNIFLPRNF